jgi:hypothetical protein
LSQGSFFDDRLVEFLVVPGAALGWSVFLLSCFVLLLNISYDNILCYYLHSKRILYYH